MIYPRRECVCCGTRFTPSNEQEVTCGECDTWTRELDDSTLRPLRWRSSSTALEHGFASPELDDDDES